MIKKWNSSFSHGLMSPRAQSKPTFRVKHYSTSNIVYLGYLLPIGPILQRRLRATYQALLPRTTELQIKRKGSFSVVIRVSLNLLWKTQYQAGLGLAFRHILKITFLLSTLSILVVIVFFVVSNSYARGSNFTSSSSTIYISKQQKVIFSHYCNYSNY